MKIRLAMAGPSGTGKTTLSKYISEKYGIPFVTTSTKPLWDKYGIASHEQLINRTLSDPAWGLQFQNEVLTYRLEKLDGLDEFVTDRSPIDNLVYFLLQNTHLCYQDQTENYIDQCKLALKLYNSIICLPYTSLIPLEDDNKRIVNKYYQMVVNETFTLASSILGQELRKMYGDTIIVWDMEARTQATDDLIKRIVFNETNSTSNS